MTIILENRRDAPVYVGSIRDITVTFRNRVTGAVGDPAVVTFKIFRPVTDVINTYTYGVDVQVVRSSLGVFYVRQTFDEAGVWVFGLTGVGGITDAKRYSVTVQPFVRTAA